ncbi:MAG: 50S ribosomal protein L20 [Candidatus Kerfeldbacteria bacterium]|nr:50S ribosomal protein L20 [Candidatus Kerfeldbacteria bacterium]
MRVKRGIIHKKHVKNILKHAKGYRWRRKTSVKLAKVAVTHAGWNAYKHRRTKKRDFRRLWQIRINAGARQNGITYSRLIPLLKAKKIELNRKVLAELAAKHPQVFAEVVKVAQAK